MKRLLSISMAALVSCGAIGGRPSGPHGTPRSPGFQKSGFVLVHAGNSISQGLRATSPVDGTTPAPTSAQLDDMLTNLGVTHTSYNESHGGYSTTHECGDGADLSELIGDVDAHWDGTKNNILILQEIINDIYCGASAEEAYEHVRQYLTKTAHRWFTILVMPTPRDNPGTTQPDFENVRQAFNALVDRDPSFGGTVDAVYRADKDTRIGLAASDSDDYFYYNPGSGSDQKVHWLYTAHAIAAGGIMDILRAWDPAKFPYKPQQFPRVAAYHSAATTGSVLTASGGVATDGQVVAEVMGDGAIESGSLLQATNANRPLYDATGFGSHPALAMTALKTMTSTNGIYVGHGTIMMTVEMATSTGYGVLLTRSAGAIATYLSTSSSTSEVAELRESDGKGTDAVVTNAVTAADHVLTFVFDGTVAGQRFYIDGVSQTLTPYSLPPATYDIDALIPNTLWNYRLGHPTLSTISKIGEVLVSPINASDHERHQAEQFLGDFRGVSITP